MILFKVPTLPTHLRTHEAPYHSPGEIQEERSLAAHERPASHTRWSCRFIRIHFPSRSRLAVENDPFRERSVCGSGSPDNCAHLLLHNSNARGLKMVPEQQPHFALERYTWCHFWCIVLYLTSVGLSCRWVLSRSAYPHTVGSHEKRGGQSRWNADLGILLPRGEVGSPAHCLDSLHEQ